jgi:hypothetical protein
MDDQIGTRISALEAELQSLKQLVEEADEQPAAATSDRRGMVKLLAAGAVGAVTGAALLGAQPVAAANGSTVHVGDSLTGTISTDFTISGDSALRLFGEPYGLESDGGTANALFSGTGPSPIGGPGSIGELYVDEQGDWWAATAESANGLWRKIAGPATAGQLHVLPTPKRVYDSRPNLQPAAVGPKSPTQSNTPRTIDTTANGSGVPPTANAVLVNLTIAGPATPGFAAAWPSGPYPGTSSVNFATGQNIAATTVVGCGANATIQVLSNTVTDFLIDVIGYYQ